MSNALAKFTTLELVEELKTRLSVEYREENLYKSYEIRKKLLMLCKTESLYKQSK